MEPAKQEVLAGETTTLTVTAEPGFEVDAVTGCDGSLSGTTYTTGAITQNCEVEATFIQFLLPPSGVAARPLEGGVEVVWDEATNAQSYVVYWSENAGIHPDTAASYDGFQEVDDSLHTIGGLANGTTYYFVVTSLSHPQESSASSEVAATPASVDETDAVSIIFDTDAGPDVDDLVAHAVLHGLVDMGEARLLASISSISYSKSPGMLNAVDTWHGRGDTPVGTFKGVARGGSFDGGPLFPNGGAAGESDGGDWAGAIYDNFPRSIGLADEVADGVAVYREVLSAEPDGSVTIVTVGMLSVVAELFESQGDDIDPRNGLDLVADKVSKIVIMGTRGRVGSAEFNMRNSPGHAEVVASMSPVPIWWMPFFEAHEIFTGKWTGSQHEGHIVRFGMEAFEHVPGADGGGRQSWDAMTVLLAVRGEEEPWSSEAGTMSIDPADGSSSWIPDEAGNHLLWSRDKDEDYFESLLEPLIWMTPAE